MAARKSGLGTKGLGIEALINDQMEDMAQTDSVKEIDINQIEPNRSQPRKHFEETALLELSESLKQYGMIQPVVLKKNGDYYEIIAGERRWRAAKIAGMQKIPAVIKKWDTVEAFEAALVENLQREDLNPLEEAESFQRLQEEFGLSQEEIAQKVGKSRSAVANALRLLQLDSRVKNFLTEGRLSGGHARALLPIENGDLQFETAEHILEEELSVRATEAFVKDLLSEKSSPAAKKKTTTFDTRNYRTIEQQLHQIFSTKVKLNSKKNKGKIEIEYYSDDDLDRLLTILKRLEG